MTLRMEAGLNEPSHRLEIVREATGSPVRMYSVMTECRTSAFLGDKARSFDIDSLRGLPLELYSMELKLKGQEAELPAVWPAREGDTEFRGGLVQYRVISKPWFSRRMLRGSSSICSSHL